MAEKIIRTCAYCETQGVEFDADEPFIYQFTPICDDCTEDLLGAYERDQEARYYREGRYAR